MYTKMARYREDCHKAAELSQQQEWDQFLCSCVESVVVTR